MFSFDNLETNLCFNFYAHTCFVKEHSPFGFFISSLNKNFWFENEREFKKAADYLINNKVHFEVVYG